MRISLDNPRGNGRLGNMGSAGGGDARILRLGECELFFSYSTLVAFRAPGIRIRTAETFSKMTGKHMREMDCARFPTLDPELFAAGVAASLALEMGRVPA